MCLKSIDFGLPVEATPTLSSVEFFGSEKSEFFVTTRAGIETSHCLMRNWKLYQLLFLSDCEGKVMFFACIFMFVSL